MKKSERILLLAGLGLLFAIGAVILYLSRVSDAPITAASEAAPVAQDLPPEPAPVASTQPVRVYDAAMTASPGEEWSSSHIEHAPKDGRPYLGNFYSNDTPTLTLKKLPPHQLLKISFDLLVVMSWDGSSPEWGPGLLDMGLDDGRSLLHCTFCNCGFFDDNNEQSFPDNYPFRPYPGFTMATEKQTLGTKFDFGSGRLIDCSSVYHMEMTFPHAEPDVTFQFEAMVKDGAKKGYGFANVKVDALPRLAQLTPEEMARAWTDLGSGDPNIFWKARWNMISAGNAAAHYISEHVEDPIPDLSDEEMKKLVADMEASSTPAKSWAAFYALRMQGPRAMEILSTAKGGMPPDLSRFLPLAPSQFERDPETATELRLQRARAVLEAIHTQESTIVRRAITAFVPPK